LASMVLFEQEARGRRGRPLSTKRIWPTGCASVYAHCSIRPFSSKIMRLPLIQRPIHLPANLGNVRAGTSGTG
jgi:hypothetical protein